MGMIPGIDGLFSQLLRYCDDNWNYILFGSIGLLVILIYLAIGGEIPWL